MLHLQTILRISSIFIITGFLQWAPVSQADIKADGLNDDKNPQFLGWCSGCTVVGWYYIAPFDYDLSGIQTNFEPGVGAERTVTVEILTDRRFAGGALLASADFDSSTARGTLGGGTFVSPVHLTAGTRYFVGFRNVQNIGINTTADAGALNLGPLGLYIDNDFVNDGQYEFRGGQPCIGSPQDQPIIRFLQPTGGAMLPGVDETTETASSALSLSRSSLTLSPILNKDMVSLKGSFSATVGSFDPSVDGAAVGLVGADGVIACFQLAPGAGWTTLPGPKWKFKDTKTGSLGDLNANEQLSIKFNAKTGKFDVLAKVKKAELKNATAGFLSSVIAIGSIFTPIKDEFMNTQVWRSTAQGKKLVTP